jgi:hypothetical protein
MNEILKKRLKSLAWKIGGMVSVLIITFLIDNSVFLNIPVLGVVFLGLLVSEITKFLNS